MVFEIIPERLTKNIITQLSNQMNLCARAQSSGCDRLVCPLAPTTCVEPIPCARLAGRDNRLAS